MHSPSTRVVSEQQRSCKEESKDPLKGNKEALELLKQVINDHDKYLKEATEKQLGVAINTVSWVAATQP